MNDKEYRDLKKISYYKEIIKKLRDEISELIKENDYLKARIKDLEEIDLSHQELVGNLLMVLRKEKGNEKKKRGFN